MTAATSCRTCGTHPREGTRFCDGCGSAIGLSDQAADCKQLTVLFAYVVRQFVRAVSRTVAISLGYEGHMAMVGAMT